MVGGVLWAGRAQGQPSAGPAESPLVHGPFAHESDPVKPPRWLAGSVVGTIPLTALLATLLGLMPNPPSDHDL